MGVPDLEIQNIGLLLQWWWTTYTKPEALWTNMITQLRWTGSQPDGPCIWARGGSFFWKQLHKLKPLFHRSTQWTVGDDRRISFWFDSWQGLPLVDYFDDNPKPPQPRITVRKAASIMHILTPELAMSDPILQRSGRQFALEIEY